MINFKIFGIGYLSLYLNVVGSDNVLGKRFDGP